jgi:hypothetical protein
MSILNVECEVSYRFTLSDLYVFPGCVDIFNYEKREGMDRLRKKLLVVCFTPQSAE